MPDQTHFSPEFLDSEEKTQAYWAVDPTDELTVFVHGFGGSAVNTWNDFPHLLPLQARCRGWDLVFFGYDSLYKQANISGSELYDLLNKLATNPTEIINPLLDDAFQRSSDFQFSVIRIVAHSLGAVVTRLALLRARSLAAPWLERTQMVFFAPAHMGANTIALAGETLTAIPYVGQLIAPLLRFRFQTLQDLEPDSDTLTQLREKTKDALRQGASYLVARKVLFGDLENIVRTGGFCEDPPLRRVAGRGHVDVCKPKDNFLQPVEEVLE